ncbi:MAG: efflux RND transporter periplasmic adaptor subunit [Deferribacteres bacterium]|nr:efflux RND transporter periplasmic adaptor subunit [Deferribacteres bacterium]
MFKLENLTQMNAKQKTEYPHKFSSFVHIAVIALALSMAAWGCGGDEGGDGSARSGAMGMMGQSQRSAAIPVQVAEVTRGDIAMFLLHTTTIEAEKQVDVLAKVTGQVTNLPAEEGMRVRKGQVLAQLDEAELKIDLIQARAKMQTDSSAYVRARDMLNKQLIAEEAYESTRLAFESSKAAFEAASLKVAYTTVRSPIDGVVTLRHIELGQRISMNQTLFSVADFNPLRAKIYVPEKDIARVREGESAKIIVDALPNRQFTGVIRMISPIVDPANGTVKVTIDIENESNQLKPGMFASVYITTESHNNTLLIPKRALILESESDQVYVNKNGIAEKVILKTGFVAGDTVEVLAGLQEGDLVVTVGQEGLREGLPIAVPGQEEVSVTSAPDSSKRQGPPQGERRRGRMEQQMAADGAEKPLPQNVDEEMVARIEKVLSENPRVQQSMEERAQQDPDFANNPAKKLAFFEQMADRWAGFMMRSPENQEAWQKKVAEDPDFEKNIEKKILFFNELFTQMRARGGFGNRRN